MNAISEQIQEPEPGAEMADSRSVVGAIADGSQAIAHDGFDVETFEQAADDYARLARTVEETTGAIRTGSALLRDLFWSFHKRSPRVAPITPLSPAHEINREIVEQVLSTTEWREMRESGTMGDPQKTIAQRLVIYKQLKAKAEMYQELLGMRQDEVRSGIVGLEREALNLLSADDNPLTSSTSHIPAPLFTQSELVAV